MNTLKNSLFAAVGVLILVGVLVLSGTPFREAKGKQDPAPVTVVNDATNPVPTIVQNGNVLVEKLPSQIVTLGSGTGAATACPLGAGKVFRELTPNVTNVAFSVPAGQVLVVTSAELFIAPQAIAQGKHLAWRLVRDNGSNSAAAFGSSVLTGPTGSGSRSVTFSPGFVVPSGVTLCFFPPGVGTVGVFVYGFLTPDM